MTTIGYPKPVGRPSRLEPSRLETINRIEYKIKGENWFRQYGVLFESGAATDMVRDIWMNGVGRFQPDQISEVVITFVSTMVHEVEPEEQYLTLLEWAIAAGKATDAPVDPA